jgi:hypothetical protein
VEKTQEAIDIAQTYLSEENCDKAIKVLTDAGVNYDDPIYREVYASAYACKADFKTVVFLQDDIPLLVTTSFQTLMTSLTKFSYSNETAVDSLHYSSLQNAIDILLHPDGVLQPSQVARTAKFGPRKAGDIGIEFLIFTITQLGKFINYFGNVDASGIKGAGPRTNKCFMNYTYPQAIAARIAGGGSCNVNNGGTSDLDTSAAGLRHRCEGLMLFTNILDVLNNLDVSGNTTFASFAAVATDANNLRNAAVTADPSLQTLLYTTSQAACLALLQTPAEANNIQLIYALLFEAGLQ